MRAYASLNDVRRKDREVEDDAWIEALLLRAPMGTIATVRDGQPFVNANTFVFEPLEPAIYMHTTNAGRTAGNVAGDERVCFTVSEMGRLLPNARAFNLSVEYAGVVVFGRAALLDGAADKERALRMLSEKYFPHLRYGEDYAPVAPDELKLTAVYRIAIDAWSGKRKVADPPDFPGAFYYGALPSAR